ncbi:MAG TPA: UPF0147 family protein [Candidatus Nanoarchaeia archaeon]|nr:UPF0147 family protein [Candidatus Nanoarchaeia archaeon]
MINNGAVIKDILEGLSLIETDISVPKNVRIRIRTTMDILSSVDNKDFNLRIDKSLQELAEVADDPNIPQYTRMQIWTVVSQLENK